MINKKLMKKCGDSGGGVVLVSNTNTTRLKLLCYAYLDTLHIYSLISTFIGIVQIWGWCHSNEEEL